MPRDVPISESRETRRRSPCRVDVTMSMNVGEDHLDESQVLVYAPCHVYLTIRTKVTRTIFNFTEAEKFSDEGYRDCQKLVFSVQNSLTLYVR